LPTSVHTGANESAISRSAGSSEASTPRRRVMPNTAISAQSSRWRESWSKTASSFGFELAKPASIRCTPSSSSACATRSFSSTESDMPSPCIPSRSVVS
jgi:hypothetical protein